VCFVIRKTTLELEWTFLTTQFLPVQKIPTVGARKGDLQHTFPLYISMVTSPKFSFVANGNNPTSISLALSETIYFW
jgi:hypothetical protein